MDRQARIDQLKSVQIQMGKPRAQRRPAVGGKWGADEDEQLKKIVHEHGAKNWKKVSPPLSLLSFTHHWRYTLLTDR
jgi:hypothetical protein